jgi:DNA-binding PadR family transcriptional regulator
MALNSFEGLSELEGYVTGSVATGATSGYAIRRRLQGEVGTTWSADSGSVYRVLRRLQARGILHQTGRVGASNRERTEYALTEHGIKVYTHWVGSPLGGLPTLAPDVSAMRIAFLESLPAGQAEEVIDQWSRESMDQMQQLQNEARREQNRARRWKLAQAIETLNARVKWLQNVRMDVCR